MKKHKFSRRLRDAKNNLTGEYLNTIADFNVLISDCAYAISGHQPDYSDEKLPECPYCFTGVGFHSEVAAKLPVV